MTKPQQQFLELLRSGLWGKPADANLFQGEIDWKTILRLATEQTVQVLVANGIETLPKELWPPKIVIFKLMEIKTKTAKMHLLLNSVLSKITTALNAEGIPSVLLKGQGLAQNYLIPESRICGDIDLYVGEENIDKAYDIVAALTDEEQEPEDGLTGKEMHRHLKVDGVVVEIHRKVASAYTTIQTHILKKWTITNLDTHFQDQTLPTINFNQITVNVPPFDFNAAFILYHAAHHMRIGGIGFRQICDWAMYLTKYHSKINQDKLKATLRDLNMIPVWKEFGRFAICVLGMDPDRLPIAPRKLIYTKGTQFILNDIFEKGNFGHYGVRHNTSKETNIIIRKWRNCLIATRRFANLAKLFPGFVLPKIIRWYYNSIKNLLQGN